MPDSDLNNSLIDAIMGQDGWVTIHYGDPFATPEQDRSPARRMRARLVAPATRWTTPGPAGLTVSSTLIADGDPARVLGLVDDESDLWAALTAAHRFAVSPLRAGQQQLADRFAGLAPAPGGLFAQDAWRDTRYGPVPAAAGTWAGCRLDASRRFGWALLVEGTIEQITLGGDESPLCHYRGRYRAVPQ
jgi:3-hydroxy-9,10-secoandrosta-1,3,5(10)-triene-9,17-dione monooxygenase reductase component